MPTSNTKTRYTVGEFHDTGVNEVDIDLVVKKWNHLWSISQYGAVFRLFKSLRKDSPIVVFKTEITAKQADELIKKLGLGIVKSGLFRKALTWTK